MFKKSAVLSSGGYKETFHLFEDYYLWIRMLMNGYKFKNIDDILLDMRTSKRMYARRGGMQYAKTLLCFHKWMYINGWSTKFDYISGLCRMQSCVYYLILCEHKYTKYCIKSIILSQREYARHEKIFRYFAIIKK